MKTDLQARNDPFRDLLQNHPRPMWVFDHETLRFLEVNSAAVTNYGYSRPEFLKMKITEIRPRDQIPRLLASIRPFRLDGAQVTQWQHLTKNGRLIDVEITSSQLYFKRRPSVFIEVRDITEQTDTLRKRTIIEERNRIAKDFHYLLKHGFTGIVAQLEAAKGAINSDPSQACRHIMNAELLAQQSLSECQRSFLTPPFDGVGNDQPETSLCRKGLRPGLTWREKQVLQLLSSGKSNKEIAAILNVTEGTIKLHVNHILKKLCTTGRTEAAIFALRTGIVPI